MRIFTQSLLVLFVLFTLPQWLPSQALPAIEGGVVEQFDGRVVDTAGLGVEGVTIHVIVDPSTCPFWPTGFYTSPTNPFGYYQSSMHSDCTTLVFPTGKEMQFDPPIVFFMFGANGQPVNFTRVQ